VGGGSGVALEVRVVLVVGEVGGGGGVGIVLFRVLILELLVGVVGWIIVVIGGEAVALGEIVVLTVVALAEFPKS